MAIKNLAVSWIKTVNLPAKNLAILNGAANLAMLGAAGANWQRWAPIENGAILLSFLAKTDHAKKEKPPAFEGRAGGTGGNPPILIT